MAAEHTTNWPELAVGIYERLTGKNAEIAYEFADMHIEIPSGTGAKAEHAEWILNGTMRISTRENSQGPK